MNSQKNENALGFIPKKEVLRNGEWAEFEYFDEHGKLRKVTGWVEYCTKLVELTEETDGIDACIEVKEEFPAEMEIAALFSGNHYYTSLVVHTQENQTIALHFNSDRKNNLVDITPLEPELKQEDYFALADLALFLNDREMFFEYSNYLREGA